MKDRTQRGVRLPAEVFAGLAISLLCGPAIGQTHKVAKQQDVVRAVGVYEWTGDMAKPAASRLIPVSLFIDGKLQDAAVYLAQPVPFALLSGNVYELQHSGVGAGTLDLQFARHLVAAETATTTYDDGWFGYGRFVPPAPPKKSTLKPVKTLASINAMDEDDDRPHFSSRSAAPGSGGTASIQPDAGTSDTPADDPDRPTLHRSGSASDQTAGSTPADDPDRPTLRRHSPADAGQARSDQPGASGASDALNNDPNRPLLHRGKPEGAPADTDFPKLAGLPGDTDLHQMVAVSDAADRPSHDFSRAWEDDNEHQAILAKMQAAARAQLTAYEKANGTAPPAPPPPPPSTAKSTTKSRHAAASPPPPPPPEPLLDEQLKGYTLSYGGAPTFVYFAHTDGLGPGLRYVTLVAQIDMKGEPEIAMKNVTDAAHLDRTPRMRLIDAVDDDASNRASLLFELRAQNSRQFALYQVIGARASQTFVTGSTQ
jgi:hypothetical protein